MPTPENEALIATIQICLSYRVMGLRQLSLILLIASADAAKLDFSALATLSGLSKPVVGRGLDRLGSLGLTRRIRNQRDHNRVFLSLTDKGKELARKLGNT